MHTFNIVLHLGESAVVEYLDQASDIDSMADKVDADFPEARRADIYPL